jgi:hypothetical protein
MFKACNNCNKQFTSIKTCRRHLEKRICFKKVEKKWQKLKNNMRICERCGIVLSSQYSLDKHLTKQVQCIQKDLKHSLLDLQNEYLSDEKIGRKKFILKAEVLCEKLGININQNTLNINLDEKPNIYIINDDIEGLTNEELIIKLKEQTNCLNKVSVWIDTAWKLLVEVSPEKIIFNNPDNQDNKDNFSEIVESNSETELNKKELILSKLNVKKSDIGDLINSVDIEHIVSIEKQEKEKKEWESIRNEKIKLNPLENILIGFWNTDNYILKPVHHYSDCYSRQLMVRNMKSAKMLSSIICPYFYPKYLSSLQTRVYIDINKKKKMWFRDDNDMWHSVDFAVGIKNMIFHAVGAFTDLIRREKEILPEDYACLWESELLTLENNKSENYKIIVKNLIDRITKLSIHPEKEEIRLAEEYLKNDDYKIDILTELSEEYNFSDLTISNQEKILYKRTIYNVRYENKIKIAKGYHLKVNEFYKTYR